MRLHRKKYQRDAERISNLEASLECRESFKSYFRLKYYGAACYENLGSAACIHLDKIMKLWVARNCLYFV